MPRRSGGDTIAHFHAPERDTHWRDRLFFAGYYFIAFVVLGLVVARRLPTPLDTAERFLAGHGLLVARALTFYGTFPVYTAISVALVILAFVRRSLMLPIFVSVGTLIVAWQVSDAAKLLFLRPRPGYWFWIHETTYSYPSGHATLVVAFYGFWTAMAWGSALSGTAKRWIRLAFVGLALGIGWSRLALGAHYLSDVIGGYLLGAALASLGMIVYRLLAAPEARAT